MQMRVTKLSNMSSTISPPFILAFALLLELINIGCNLGVVADQVPTFQEITAECKKTKGCISPCLNKPTTCHIILTYQKLVDYYHFEILADLPSNAGYVAMGLSKDSQMGHDLVVECVNYGSQVGVFQSWNTIYKNYRIAGTECPGKGKHGLVDCSVTVANGKIYCQFTRYRVIAHQFMKIGRMGISNSKFYVLLVTGDKVTEKGITEHHHPSFATNMAIDFNLVNQEKRDNRKNRLAHVYLMTITWIILVPNAMFVARYLKETMTEITCCDRKLWFFGHTGLMSIGFVLCVGSICCIMWNRSYNDSKWPLIPSIIHHANIGLAAATFFMVQIISGWYRPTGRTARKTYSVVHASLGTIAYILAVTNFMRSYYQGMPCYIVAVVVGVLIWQTLWHIFMILHYKWLDGNLGLKACRALSPAPIKVILFDDAPGKAQRLRITIINFIGSCIFAAAICLIYQLNTGPGCSCDANYCKRIPHTPD